METGMELIVDAYECSETSIADLGTVRAVCERIIEELQLTVVGKPLWHQFPSPSGVTGMYLLSESHLTCHTFPEYGLATFNLYCCRSLPEWPWSRHLHQMIGADRVDVRMVSRGTLQGSARPR